MAVYHASRPRERVLDLPAGRPAAQGVLGGAPGIAVLRSAIGAALGEPGATQPRRRTRLAVRAGRRSGGRVGLFLTAIIVAFILAFFSLAQSVRVSATAYDIDRLMTERSRLEARRQELLSDLNRLGREPAVRKQAIEFGLAPIAEPLIIAAR